MINVDLDATPLRELNQQLHALAGETNETAWTVTNPKGQHAIACGLDAPVSVMIQGHAGYYCAGMNKQADVVIDGHVGWGVGENMMSGTVRVKGNASQAAGASGHGGLLVIEGDASARCGISMKGIDIVVQGSVGHMSAFMAQAGNLVVCGDAGESLGDSLYEATLFVAGEVESLGADCEQKEMTDDFRTTLEALLAKAGIDKPTDDFKVYGSARKLYNFNIDHLDAY